MKRLIGTVIASLAFLTLQPGEAGAQEKDSSKSSDDTAKKSKIVVGKSLPKQLCGYWAADVDAMIKMTMEQMKEAGGADAKLTDQMKVMMAQMFAAVIFEFTADKATFHMPGENQTSSYKILSANPATGVLEMEIIDEKGKVQKGSAIIKENQLTLKGDKKGGEGTVEEILFNRISEAEFKKRLEANKNRNPEDLLLQEPDIAEPAKE